MSNRREFISTLRPFAAGVSIGKLPGSCGNGSKATHQKRWATSDASNAKGDKFKADPTVLIVHYSRVVREMQAIVHCLAVKLLPQVGALPGLLNKEAD